ncbi:hypothetical protein DFH08DRAFT_813710 [Mycena albidolilacea]|uniref:Uncharacterized protein n=1 Tax=Mycena albidolilacea TaxID=1033008 RepID=A0AAD6ZQV7_9AGAR|nr:hypothetical protein DFH08DRAFT_813710 [Mycena albidolilacea]
MDLMGMAQKFLMINSETNRGAPIAARASAGRGAREDGEKGRDATWHQPSHDPSITPLMERSLNDWCVSALRLEASPLYKRDLKGRSLDAYRAQAKAELKDKLRKDLDYDPESDSMVDFDRVMDGSERIELSHAGGKLHSTLADEIEEEVQKKIHSLQGDLNGIIKYDEIRHNDGTLTFCLRWNQWSWHSDEKIWTLDDGSDDKADEDSELYTLIVVDMFDAKNIAVTLDPRGEGIAPALIMKGLIPCSPWKPTVAITVRVLELEGEEELTFSQLFCVDGNNSMKCIFLREKIVSEGDTGDGAEFVLGETKECEDSWDARENLYLPREKVNKFAKHRLAKLFPPKATEPEVPENPCASRWKNMMEDITSKMWGVFDETRIFVALYSFVLLIVDMVRSGELAKYPLAIVDCLLKHLGKNLGCGYDVECDFATTFRNSPLGERAREANFQPHMSLDLGWKTWRDVNDSSLAPMGWQGLAGKFLYNQALDILKKESALHSFMKEENIESYNVFEHWLGEEKEYLLGLKDSSKTDVETLEMEFFLVLQRMLDTMTHPIHQGYQKLARCHGKEKMDKDLEIVQELEDRLEISDWWTIDSPQWAPTVLEFKKQKYWQALDAMELLIVEQIFELTKMNQSQTALQARSKAVRNIINRYNAAVIVMETPMAQFTWEQVVEYTFLADFDILRDTCAEVQAKPWTRPSYHLTMDTYFKIQWAREEIQRLNIEIRRLITWICDEDSEVASVDSWGFDDIHMQRFYKLAKVKGFTGNLRPGRAVENLEELGGGDEMDVDDVSDGLLRLFGLQFLSTKSFYPDFIATLLQLYYSFMEAFFIYTFQVQRRKTGVDARREHSSILCEESRSSRRAGGVDLERELREREEEKMYREIPEEGCPIPEEDRVTGGMELDVEIRNCGYQRHNTTEVQKLEDQNQRRSFVDNHRSLVGVR